MLVGPCLPWLNLAQCFQIFGFHIFGFGFPNNAKTSDFEYRIRSFMRQEKATKGGILQKKSSWSNDFFVKHHTCGFKKEDWTIFLSLKEEKGPKSESEYSVYYSNFQNRVFKLKYSVFRIRIFFG